MISASKAGRSARGSILRKVLLVLGALVLLLLVAEVVLGMVAGVRLKATVADLEERWGSLDPATLAPPQVEPTENRTKPIRAAAELVVVERGEEYRVVGDMASPGGRELQALEERILAKVLERNRLALEVLGEALERRGSSWDIDYERGFYAEIPPLLPIVDLSKLNAALGRRELLAGNTEEALLAAGRGLVLVDSMLREPVLIFQLVALKQGQLAAGLVRDMLARAEPDEEGLVALQGLLRPQELGQGIHTGLVGEMKVFHQVFRYMDSGTARSIGTEPTLLESAPLRWLARPLVRENLRFYLEGMGGVLEYHDTPRYLREAKFPASPLEREPRWYHFFVQMMLPDMGAAIDRADLGQARMALTYTALALRRYRLAEGRYPESLEALVPAYLDEILLDPFTGEAPAYRLEGEGFVLRSAGEGYQLKGAPERDHVLSWRIPR